MPCVHPERVAHARAGLAEESVYRGVADIFGALADPTRAKLIHLLLHQELCTCDLASVVGVSESAVSQHLRLLRALRLVKARRAGKFVYYTLDDAHVGLLMQLGLTHQGHGAGAPETGQAHASVPGVAVAGAPTEAREGEVSWANRTTMRMP
ncbi:MAG TPA: metalloregulator ArsR/SmtB family transcription factor [Ktedonobacterales bacterium]|nr:metalloregulator ArsR/SmtB family transcription factor [Ktedonobacterales bacterium]